MDEEWANQIIAKLKKIDKQTIKKLNQAIKRE
jgi:hypothetical protein